ncbi:MAG: GIY-YIG nuclease family protein [Bacteroidota bacterium]|nr:GIY-YIG nuclease family protein [Bacteroidota bacterium]MDP3558581.1 GIY-YIG nuclease family protein [Bacteroidota bacterium]
MASVYILFSPKLNKFYVGSCLDLEQRLLDHKNKLYSNSYTKVTDDWLLYFERSALDGLIARKIETHIKSMKSKKYIENLKTYPEMIQKLVIKFSKAPK